MEKKTKILIGVGVGVAALAIIAVITKKHWMPAKKIVSATEITNITLSPEKATKEQFDKLVQRANDSGSDWFKNVQLARLKELQQLFIKNLNITDGDRIATLLGKSNSISASEKIELNELYNKWRKS